MTAAKASLLACLAVVAVVTLVALGPQAGVAQGDPFLGTWVLNVVKSRFLPVPPPKDRTVTYEAAGAGVKVTAKGTNAAGQPTETVFTASYDGKDYPVVGNPDWDSISMKRVDSNTVQFTRKKAGKVVQTGTNAVSRDGKTRTITATGVNAQGQSINTIGIYDRK